MNNEERCFLCDNVLSNRKLVVKTHPLIVHSYTCKVCGNIEVEQIIEVTGLENNLKDKKHLISGYTRELTYKHLEAICLTDEKIKEILESGDIPQNVPDKIDKILLYLANESKPVGKYIDLNINIDYSIAYAENSNEFIFLLKYLRESKLIETSHSDDYFKNLRLTIPGWQKVYELERHGKKSDQAFVAMRFNNEMMEIFKSSIKPAIENSERKFKALLISEEEFNDKICDRIIAEIRKSAFIVADFTGQRSNVYFEAGFALGLGIPVIWMCREDEVEKLKEHFDTRQYNHIIWKDEKDLYTKLLNRINATLITH